MASVRKVLLGEEFRLRSTLKTLDENSFQNFFSLKRWLDLFGSAVLIVVFSPLFVIIATIVALDDGWPIIYKRRVVGRHGEFDALKFRTMHVDADAQLNSNPILRAQFERNFKLKDDPRVTRIGCLIRKTSLDELPQLINVFLGQMSLVGPRMFTAGEIQKYGVHKDLVLSVKPGMTGYWQVSGRQNISYEERVRMDVFYVNNRSLVMDLKILFLTPFKVLQRDGAF